MPSGGAVSQRREPNSPTRLGRSRGLLFGLLLASATFSLYSPRLFGGYTDSSGCASEGAGGLVGMSRQSILLFGDSITQFSFSPGGWGARLAHTYQRRADVLNRGYSGYNTRWALELLEKMPNLKPPPILATVFLGANDAALPDRSSARQHVPVTEYTENLRRIVNFLMNERGISSVILIAPPPIHEAARLENLKARSNGGEPSPELPERTNYATGKYAEAVCSLASELGIPVVNLWEAFQEVEGWETKLLDDGLHLTAEGNEAVYNELWRVISSEASLAPILPDAVLLDAPLHGDIDPAQPAAAFKDPSLLRRTVSGAVPLASAQKQL